LPLRLPWVFGLPEFNRKAVAAFHILK